MQKIIGMALLGAGISGELYTWLKREHEKRNRMEKMRIFLQKSIYAMEENNVRWIDFFQQYESEDAVIDDSLHEMACRLKQNIYPKGEQVWEEVLREKQGEWDCSKETFELLIHLGHAFFGRSKKENLEFLRSYLRQLEACMEKDKERFAEQKKVWIPVSMLGGIMLIIILI